MNSRYPELAPAQAWQLAYQWLCQRRRHYPANADIWHLRFHWPARSATLFARVMAGHYRLSPMQLLGGHAIWSAEDALVLKWVALRVAPRLPWHPACEHGRGMGVVASRRRLHDFLQGAGGSHPYVLRTDIRGYYQHIDRARVLSRLVAPLPCPVCRELMRQYLYYSVECGGEFHTPGGGISRGCALSPLIGASLLWHIDADFAARGELYYARYMDDFIVLARTRWRLRDAVRRLNGYLAADGFSQHPAKTWIGRLDRGIDWLGGWYTTAGRVGIAPNALQRYRTKSLRLYEQTLRAGNSETECQRRVRGYFMPWRRPGSFADHVPKPALQTAQGKTDMTHKPRITKKTKAWGAIAAAAAFSCSTAALAGTVIAPVAYMSSQSGQTSCSWTGIVTAQAEEFDSSVLIPLENYSYWAHGAKMMGTQGTPPTPAMWLATGNDAGGVPPVKLTGSGADRLAQVNKAVFGTPTPKLGTKTVYHVNKFIGLCPTYPDFECSDFILTDDTTRRVVPGDYEPNVFPPNHRCRRVDLGGPTCVFTAPNLNIDFGTFGPGPTSAGVNLPIKCSGSADFNIRLATGGSSVSNKQVRIDLTVDGGTMPKVYHPKQAGTANLAIKAVASPNEGATGQFSMAATILVDAM
ncbi:reverse transcriptase domain-containing protein [Aeromonas sp. 602200]|uniref:reverse transcriptase domain-containing protein n=1 Tax=Aeromonas sp. 602200 TaxID=2712040 RepID=UPI003B9DDB81